VQVFLLNNRIKVLKHIYTYYLSEECAVNIWIEEGRGTGLRRLHDEELHSLYSSPNIIRVITSRRIGCSGHVALAEMTNSYRILAGKPEGNRALARRGRRCETLVKLVLKKLGVRA
jgi:hypothetical protein